MISTQKRLIIVICLSVLVCIFCIYNFYIMSTVVKKYNDSDQSITEFENSNNVNMKDVYTSYVIYFAIFIFFLLTIIFCISQSIELHDHHLQVLFNNSSFILFSIAFIIILGLFTAALKKYQNKTVFYIDIGIIVLLSMIVSVFVYNLLKKNVAVRGRPKSKSSSSRYSGYSTESY